VTERKPQFGVGYLLPPAERQFKKGQSGNPSGRPKGAKSLRTVIKEAASKKLSVVEDGKRKKKSKMDLMVTQMFNRAAQGEARFTQMALDQYSNIENRLGADRNSNVFEEADLPVIAQIIARIRRTTEGNSNE
jgi:Family of unknown function (DUF5681)